MAPAQRIHECQQQLGGASTAWRAPETMAWMSTMVVPSPNSRLWMPSKHFCRWGCTARAFFVCEMMLTCSRTGAALGGSQRLPDQHSALPHAPPDGPHSSSADPQG